MRARRRAKRKKPAKKTSYKKGGTKKYGKGGKK